MWYPSAVTVPPASEPITLAEAKAHLRVDASADDTLITRLVTVSRSFVEDYCASRFATQTVVMKCDGFDDLARMPEAPIQSVTSVTYVDTAGATQTLSTDVYELRADGLEAAIVTKYGKTWPIIRPGSRVTVTAVVGTATTPPPVKHAMLLHLAFSYERREGGKTTELDAMAALLSNYRRGA